MRFKMLTIALLINWEFVILTLAHLNENDAKVDTNLSSESLKAQQSPENSERLYLKTADGRKDDCERNLNTRSPSDPTENSIVESTFKCHACADHGWDKKWGNAGQNRRDPTQNEESEELPQGHVTWQYLRS